jgi:Carboxypeptidase regulatory-like domain/Tissue inhibitor of metalloproteinase
MIYPSKYLLFAALIVFLVVPREIHACSCAGSGSPCEAYGKASAVFTGIVTGGSLILIKDGDEEYQQQKVSFAIEESFRGVEGAQTEVITGLGDSDCGFDFERGKRYLVYAYRSEQDKRLYTSICSRTRALSEANEDLKYLRGLSSASPGVHIYGEVQKIAGSWSQSKPMAGVKVNIDGEKRQAETVTDFMGHFSIAGLPGGAYKVKISLPQGVTSNYPEQEIEVADRGCARVHFGVLSDGRLSGKVLDANGKPASVAAISIHKVPEKNSEPSLENGNHSDTVYSGKDGVYEFKAIPPGRYAFSIRYDGNSRTERPYPYAYHPGVKDIDQAISVRIGEGERIEKYDLVLPPLPSESTVTGVVVWSDGKPVRNASIHYLEINGSTAYTVEHDKEGRFSFKLYDGLKIKMIANVNVGKEKFIHSDSVEVTATGEDIKVKLVIPR